MIAKKGSKPKGLTWAMPPRGGVLHSPGGDHMLDAELSCLCLEELIKLRLNSKEAGSSALLLQEGMLGNVESVPVPLWGWGCENRLDHSSLRFYDN